jgi:excinuclease ABC subunit A
VSEQVIRLRGVSVNNLRQIDLDLAHRRLIVVCGVSGSGKTSLALDTLYAEGQRRYIESFSAYTRRFLEQLDKPEAELIDGIPPAIAVTHSNPSRSNRATVGTSTEVNDYLSLLFGRVGEVICYGCGELVQHDSPESAADALISLAPGTRLMLGFEEEVPPPKSVEAWLADFIEQGYIRAVVGDATESLEPGLAQKLKTCQRITIVIDRLSAGDASVERLRESVETTFAAGEGTCVALVEDTAGDRTIDGRQFRRLPFSAKLRCDKCRIDYPEPEPQLFDFNRPLGACPECEGFGNVVATDMARVVPDPSK